jgi:hypothetical protein
MLSESEPSPSGRCSLLSIGPTGAGPRNPSEAHARRVGPLAPPSWPTTSWQGSRNAPASARGPSVRRIGPSEEAGSRAEDRVGERDAGARVPAEVRVIAHAAGIVAAARRVANGADVRVVGKAVEKRFAVRRRPGTIGVARESSGEPACTTRAIHQHAAATTTILTCPALAVGVDVALLSGLASPTASAAIAICLVAVAHAVGAGGALSVEAAAARAILVARAGVTGRATLARWTVAAAIGIRLRTVGHAIGARPRPARAAHAGAARALAAHGARVIERAQAAAGIAAVDRWLAAVLNSVVTARRLATPLDVGIATAAPAHPALAVDGALAGLPCRATWTGGAAVSGRLALVLHSVRAGGRRADAVLAADARRAIRVGRAGRPRRTAGTRAAATIGGDFAFVLDLVLTGDDRATSRRFGTEQAVGAVRRLAARIPDATTRGAGARAILAGFSLIRYPVIAGRWLTESARAAPRFAIAVALAGAHAAGPWTRRSAIDSRFTAVSPSIIARRDGAGAADASQALAIQVRRAGAPWRSEFDLAADELGLGVADAVTRRRTRTIVGATGVGSGVQWSRQLLGLVRVARESATSNGREER